MAKGSKIKRSSYNRKVKSEKVSTFTEQQKFDFGGELDSIDNLDVSFVEEKKRSKVKKSLEKEYVEPVKKKAYNLLGLVITCFGLTLVLVYFIVTGCYSSTKIVEKVVEKEVIKNDDNYLFLGDSITDFYDLEKYFSGKPVVNSGISGHTTKDILNDMKKRVYNYNPSKVFILIGINDLHIGLEKDEVVNNILEIVTLIKKNRPYCEIYLESIYPVNNTDDEKIDHGMIGNSRNNEKVKAVNEELKKLSKKEDIHYIDLYPLLIDDEGNLKLEYTTEGLHISDEGYEIITKELNKYLEEK